MRFESRLVGLLGVGRDGVHVVEDRPALREEGAGLVRGRHPPRRLRWDARTLAAPPRLPSVSSVLRNVG